MEYSHYSLCGDNSCDLSDAAGDDEVNSVCGDRNVSDGSDSSSSEEDANMRGIPRSWLPCFGLTSSESSEQKAAQLLEEGKSTCASKENQEAPVHLDGAPMSRLSQIFEDHANEIRNSRIKINVHVLTDGNNHCGNAANNRLSVNCLNPTTSKALSSNNAIVDNNIISRPESMMRNETQRIYESIHRANSLPPSRLHQSKPVRHRGQLCNLTERNEKECFPSETRHSSEAGINKQIGALHEKPVSRNLEAIPVELLVNTCVQAIAETQEDLHTLNEKQESILRELLRTQLTRELCMNGQKESRAARITISPSRQQEFKFVRSDKPAVACSSKGNKLSPSKQSHTKHRTRKRNSQMQKESTRDVAIQTACPDEIVINAVLEPPIATRASKSKSNSNSRSVYVTPCVSNVDWNGPAYVSDLYKTASTTGKDCDSQKSDENKCENTKQKPHHESTSDSCIRARKTPSGSETTETSTRKASSIKSCDRHARHCTKSREKSRSKSVKALTKEIESQLKHDLEHVLESKPDIEETHISEPVDLRQTKSLSQKLFSSFGYFCGQNLWEQQPMRANAEKFVCDSSAITNPAPSKTRTRSNIPVRCVIQKHPCNTDSVAGGGKRANSNNNHTARCHSKLTAELTSKIPCKVDCSSNNCETNVDGVGWTPLKPSTPRKRLLTSVNDALSPKHSLTGRLNVPVLGCHKKREAIRHGNGAGGDEETSEDESERCEVHWDSRRQFRPVAENKSLRPQQDGIYAVIMIIIYFSLFIISSIANNIPEMFVFSADVTRFC